MRRSAARILKKHHESIDGIETDLRLDLAQIVVEGIAENSGSQREFAKSSGIDEAIVSRIVHCRENFTIHTVARILHSLHKRGKLIAQLWIPERRALTLTDHSGGSYDHTIEQDATDETSQIAAIG